MYGSQGRRWFGSVWLNGFRRDLKHTARALSRAPGFAAVVILTLTIGIGATTAVFTVANAVLLRALPYEAPDRLVRLMMNTPPFSGTGPMRRIQVGLSQAQREQVMAGVTSLTHAGAATEVFASWPGRDPRLQGARLTASTLEMLGARPLMGRILDRRDEVPGTASLMLSELAWRRYFNANADVLGQTITLESALGDPDPTVYTIVGVMPEAFAYPSPLAQFWTTFAASSSGAGGPFVARMAPGVTVESAAAEIVPRVRELRKGAPNAAATTYELVGELDEIVSPVRRALLIVAGAVACLLLIACVNVANLLLARALGRQREIAIRLSVGAARRDILRLAFAESLVLVTFGGIGGLLLAAGSVHLFKTLATIRYRFDLGAAGRSSFPRLETIALDGTALLFTAGVCLAVALLFGVVSSARDARRSPSDMLRGGHGASGRGPRSLGHVRMRGLFVIAEVALAMMLLVGGGLLINSFMKLARVNPGFEAAEVLTFQISLPGAVYPEARQRQFAETMVERLRTVPGVQAAGYANQLPMVDLKNTSRLYRTPDATRKPERGGPDARLVSRDYLQVMRVPLTSGRGFQAGDTAQAPHVMVINETLARDEFPNADPIGQLVYIGRSIVPWRIVGVFRDVHQFGLDRDVEPQFFVDVRQVDQGVGAPVFPIGAYFAVRLASRDVSASLNLDRVVKDIEPQAMVFNQASMEELVSTTISRPRTYAVLLGIFSFVGLALAVIGIYGLIAYAVSQRTREIGIRLAIGAQPGEVMWLVLRQSVTLTLTGIAIGLLLAVVVTRSLEGLLFGVTRLDLPTFATVSVLFLGVAALASCVPARRAMRIDPAVTLRQE